MVPELDLSRYGIEPPLMAGLDPGAVKRLLADDLGPIILPTQHLKNAPGTCLQGHVGWEMDSDAYIADVVEKRFHKLTYFLSKASLAVMQTFGIHSEPLAFQYLAGDSHCGAQRPLLIHLPTGPHVAKFADPRPYLLLREVLKQISQGIGIDVSPPPIFADSDNRWYFLPYLPPFREAVYEVDSFMFASGVLTATAYCLRMVDLHLENVRMWNGLPVIIDPECILYHFVDEDGSSRLRNTGLLSHDHHFSALRGGGTTTTPMFSLGLHLCGDGTLDYYQPVNDQTNRIKDAVNRQACRSSRLSRYIPRRLRDDI